MKKYQNIILDRDGVLNHLVLSENASKGRAPRDLNEIKFPDELNIIKQEVSRYNSVVVTNQPDVARGLMTEDSVQQINRFLVKELGIDLFYVCIHDDEDECECRKPKDGLLRKAAIDLNLNLESSFMVGDRWSDIQAGQSAGCTCYFVDYSYDEKRPDPPFYTVDSLLGAVKDIVRYYDKTRAQ